eukprot:8342664-Pyramimonas_sp.AAC.1
MMSTQRGFSGDMTRWSGSSSSSCSLVIPPWPLRRSTRVSKPGCTRWRGQVLAPLDQALGAWCRRFWSVR